MSSSELVAVSSRSFSKHPMLRQQLQKYFPQVKFNEDGVRLTGNALTDFLQGARRAIIGLEIIDDKMLSVLPDLRAICKMGTGIDKIDMEALKKRKIAFSHTPVVNKRSVSELVLGLIFTLLRQLPTVSTLISQGNWQQPKGQLLSNKTIGIVGFGTIGQDLAALLNAFECNCLIYDARSYNDLSPHILQVNLDILLKESDIISLHIPLTPENYHFFGAKEFAKMKKEAVLINTARGGLVDEKALYYALKNNQLYAAALDVFEHEPNIPIQLLELNNFFATSHIGGSTEEAIKAMGFMAIDNLVKMEIL